jgi:rare lipoprotein A (peptidoglycan hydrolase)
MRRRLAAGTLLPIAATMTTSGMIAAAPGLAQEPPLPEQPVPEQTSAPDTREQSKTKIRADRHVMAGGAVKVTGRVRPAVDGQQVVVHVPGKDRVTRTGPSGKFAVKFRVGGAGEYRVQASAQGTNVTTGSESKAVKVTAYRPAAASWYGPGLYGNGLACGGTLTPSTVGVAHKSLPCGTKLTLRYKGNTVEVEVIDRGPYVGGREFDLTAATKQKLGFPSTGTVLSSR